jgi:xylulose-5-phosphate/fructose-6-phosphate phosphoketolase
MVRECTETCFTRSCIPEQDSRRDHVHLRQLETWLRSYQPERLFTADGRLDPELAKLAPAGRRRMSANPITNGTFLHAQRRWGTWPTQGNIPCHRLPSL